MFTTEIHTFEEPGFELTFQGCITKNLWKKLLILVSRERPQMVKPDGQNILKLRML